MEKLGNNVEMFLPSERTYMEELAHLAALALLEGQKLNNNPINTPQPNQTPTFEQVKPSSRFGQLHPSAQTGPVFQINGGRGGGSGVCHTIYAYGYAGFYVGSQPVYRFVWIQSPASQVKNFVEPRIFMNQDLNWVKPQPVPVKMNMPIVGGPFKELGGTGVFFPHVEFRNKFNGKKNEDNPCKYPVKNVSNGKKDVGLKSQSEMGLPQEWTY